MLTSEWTDWDAATVDTAPARLPSEWTDWDAAIVDEDTAVRAPSEWSAWRETTTDANPVHPDAVMLRLGSTHVLPRLGASPVTVLIKGTA